MQRYSFGKIHVIPGENQSRFPSCTSILINDDIKVIIDPGAGFNALRNGLGELQIDYVLNTHYHFDHISCNYLFAKAQILINPLEQEVLRSPQKVAGYLGIKEVYGEKGVIEWTKSISRPEAPQAPYSPAHRHEWWLSTGRVNGYYVYDEVLNFGTTRVRMYHAPGHTSGFCCPFFLDEGVVYTGDIDVTAFGAWYAGSDGDIDLFVQSARSILNLDANIFITGHQEGVLTRKVFEKRLSRFLGIIDEREERLAALLEFHPSLESILQAGIVYHPKYLADPWIRMWEIISIKKHAERLSRRGYAPASEFLACYFGNKPESNSRQ